jgi:signal transduction histidine kinase
VVKHARATSATVRIAATDDTVSIEVNDGGRGTALRVEIPAQR